MYGDGASEEFVGEAMSGRRDEVFLVSKVYPWNASRQGTVRACEASLKRLGTDHLDLYLLHWRGEHPLEETVAAMESLKRAGKIGAWGVSNFDVADMEELMAVPGGENCVANQVLFNLSSRAASNLTSCPGARRATSPSWPILRSIEQGRLLQHPALIRIAKAYQATPAQVALAFVLEREGVVAIPKTSSEARVKENRGAVDLDISDEDWATLDAALPPPTRKRPLEML